MSPRKASNGKLRAAGGNLCGRGPARRHLPGGLQPGAGRRGRAAVAASPLAPPGDARLSERLVQSVQVRVEHPTSSFPAAERSELAVAGCYWLIDQPPDSQVKPENILAPHRRRTLRRTQGQDTMLRIQDGADLNFAEHPSCAGWGPIGRNKRSQGTPGLPMHAALAVSGPQAKHGRQVTPEVR